MRMLLALAALCLLASATGWAGDLITMPTPDMRAENEIWGTYYHVWLSPPGGGEDEMGLVNVSVGLTPQLEADLVYGSGGGLSFTTLNLALQASVREGWKATAGVVNLFSDDYFRSEEPSPYLMASKRFVVGEQKEGKRTYALEPFLAWGSQSHRGWFGGVTAELSAQTRVVLANYPDPWGDHRAVFGIWHTLPKDHPNWALGLGVWGGSPWLAVGTPGGWVPWPRLP